MKSVLLLDDRPDSSDRVKLILEQNFAKLRIQQSTFDDIGSDFMDFEPELIFIDPLLPDPIQAMDLFACIRNDMPNTKAILHSKLTHRKIDLLEYLRGGACGFISKLAPRREYLRAFFFVLRGEIYLTDEVRTDLTSILWAEFNPDRKRRHFRSHI